MGQPTLQPGSVLRGKYVVRKLLGQGGMGKVYEAVHQQIDKTVAVKLLNPEHSGDEKLVERFQREAKAAASIGHHGIIDIYDIGVSDEGAPFLVMEHLVGQTLSSALDSKGRFDEATTAYVACQALSALAAAHDAGIVHRDLKPDNIFLVDVDRPLPEVKLLDFGISKILASTPSSQSLTVTGSILGTPIYMSPEQARGASTLDNRVDIWAMGIILYECLTGAVPFTGNSYNEVLAKILTRDVVSPIQLFAEISEELERIVMKALAKEREDRYGSAPELLVDLLPYVDERYAINISMSPQLRDSANMRGFVLDSSAPTLLESSSNRQPSEASGPPPRAVANTEFTTGETLADDGSSMAGDERLPTPLPLVKQGHRSRWAAVALVPLVLVAVVVVAVVLVSRDGERGHDGQGADETHQRGRQVPAPPPTEHPVEPSKVPSQSQTIEIRISVLPEAATIAIDGRPAGSNPFVGQLRLDEDEHHIRAAARGYKTATSTVVFDEDRNIEIELVKKRSGSGKRPSRPPRRGDDEDPWAGESPSPGPAQEDPWPD